MTEPDTPFANIDTLIDRWCERRDLWALRQVLPVYPLAGGLKDEWQSLYQALRLVRSQYSQQMPQEEQDLLGEAIVLIGQRLHDR